MTNLEHALKYLEMGWPVFPARKDAAVGKDGTVIAPAKKPHVPWEKYQSQLPTKAEVTEWWTRWPDAMIGVATGKLAGFIVVDTEKDADLSIHELEEVETPQAATGGGGIHYYFQYEPSQNAVRFAPLHDFRGDGGFVIIPPSGHPSGGTYSWIVPFGSVPLAPLPSSVREALKATGAGKSIKTLLNVPTGQGGRNQGAASVAGALLARFGAGEWETKAWPLLQAWNTTHAVPPLSQEELRATFDSISRSEATRRQSEGRGVPTYAEDELEPEVVVNGDTVSIRERVDDGVAEFEFSELEQSKNRELDSTLVVRLHVPGSHAKPFSGRINIMSMSAREGFSRTLAKSFGKNLPWDLLLSRAAETLRQHWATRDTSLWIEDAEDEETRMLFDPFLDKGGANVFFGKGGSGKTFISLRIALSYALGIPFLDFTPAETGVVLFVDYEATKGEIKNRLRRIAKGDHLAIPMDSLEKRFRYINLDGALPDCLPTLKKVIAEHGIGLLVIDSAVQACGGEPEKADVASRYFNALRSLSVPSLTIAHETKLENHAYPFGSVFFWNAPRNIWNVQCDSDDDDRVKQVGLFHRKNNNGPIHRAMAVRLFHGEDQTEVGWGDRGLWENELTTGERVLRRIREKGVLDKLALYQALPEVKKDTVDKSVARLRKQGKIVCLDEVNGLWSVPPPDSPPKMGDTFAS